MTTGRSYIELTLPVEQVETPVKTKEQHVVGRDVLDVPQFVDH